MDRGRGGGGISLWGHCFDPSLGPFVLCIAVLGSCSLSVAAIQPPVQWELCEVEVELFQSGYGIKKGHGHPLPLAQDLHKTTEDVQIMDSAQRGGSSRLGWIILAIGLALPAVLQVLIFCLGRLPPPGASKQESTRYPPASVFIFTTIIRVGAMANFTVILPFAAAMSTSSGQGSDDSGYLIAVTSAGSIAGLLPFWSIPVEKLRLACIWHGLIMFFGNACWAWAGQVRSFALLTMARLFVGLEAGVLYNTGIGISHHARGAAVTTCWLFHQFALDFGILLGPVFAVVSSWVMIASGFSNAQLQDEAGNLFMALWGILLVAALLIQGPLPEPPPEEDVASDKDSGNTEVQAQLEDVQGARPASDCSGSEEKSEAKDNTLGLLLYIAETGYLRQVQRLLFESGMIYILQVRYEWSPSASGLVMLPTITYCLVVEVFCGAVLQGTLSDKTLVFISEIKQVLGCLLMLYDAQAENKVPVGLILGGMITYGGNALCGATNNALCVKRFVPGSIAGRDALMMGSHAGVFAGCCFGALASRVVLGESPSPHFLVLLMLATCCCQLAATFLTIDMQEHSQEAMPTDELVC